MKDTANVKVKSTPSFGIRYSDLVDKAPIKKDAKVTLLENKLLLTQNNETKEYTFKDIKKDKDVFLIRTSKGEDIVISKSNNVIHVKINDELFVLKEIE
ncbi:MAG: hypothetical protein Q4Q06_06695 [Bacteroidota bacterium]|nr:hypothetical protein [Bacteroidota bacterium]